MGLILEWFVSKAVSWTYQYVRPEMDSSQACNSGPMGYEMMAETQALSHMQPK